MRDRIEIRARAAVAQCLVRRLIVPRIYFEADWPLADSRVDVLAIDRDGVGDAHVVEIKHRASDSLRDAARLLRSAEAPFRWIAFVRGSGEDVSLTEKELTDPDPSRQGRIGVIEVVEMGNDLGANVRISAERFAAPVYEVATAFSGSHKADIQFGD